ncbi:MAG: serine/threonine-protein kinase [Dokdonella sp.]
MKPDQRSDELESLAARIADDEPVSWPAARGAGETQTLNGLREVQQLMQGYRHLQLDTARNTPRSCRFRFGTLTVIEPLGSGTQGEVWRAYDPALDLQVALKLRKTGSDALAHQFLDEARRLARVRHANIVSVYGAAVHDGRAGLWTELVRGATLSALLDGHGPFPADETRGIGLDLCHALAAVHRHGLVHGDIKAANVMREVSGRIVLMDFGAARELDAPQTSVVSGTLNYLAPEVLRGAGASPASDIYALGALLFHLASGKFPYMAKGLDALIEAQDGAARIRLRTLRPDLPVDMARAIDAALDADPARRPPTALAFAAALAAQPASAAGRGPWALLALLAALALALSGAHFWPSGNIAPWQATSDFVRVDARGSHALADGASIALGDRLALQFHSNQAAFVYVFDDDGSDTAAVLFPLPDLEPSNPLLANTSYRLPGKRAATALTWQVSSAAAREEFVVVAATAAQPELERAIVQWKRADAAHATPSRGTLGLAAAPDDVQVGSPPLREILARLEHGGNAEVRHWRFDFPHAAIQ